MSYQERLDLVEYAELLWSLLKDCDVDLHPYCIIEEGWRISLGERITIEDQSSDEFGKVYRIFVGYSEESDLPKDRRYSHFNMKLNGNLAPLFNEEIRSIVPAIDYAVRTAIDAETNYLLFQEIGSRQSQSEVKGGDKPRSRPSLAEYSNGFHCPELMRHLSSSLMFQRFSAVRAAGTSQSQSLFTTISGNQNQSESSNEEINGQPGTLMFFDEVECIERDEKAREMLDRQGTTLKRTARELSERG